MSERVNVSIAEGVADVRLNRPEKLNGLDPAMFEELVDTGRRLAEDRALRVVVLSGEGRAFCAGLDFKAFFGERKQGDGAPGLLDRRVAPANFAQSAAWVWSTLPVPVIAAVHGVAFGGGLQIALAADLRVVAPDAQLSVMEIKWGLIPDMTGSQTLRHLVRLDVAKELTFTGRIVSGEEAVRIGLATRVAADPRATAFEIAREIAAKSPSAIRAGKELFQHSWMEPVADGLAREERLQRGLLGKAHQLEAVQANFEKRAPRFRDPEA